MPRYRKKPIVIEAFQMTKERRWDNLEWPEWLHEAWNKEPCEPGSLFIDPADKKRELLCIKTLEGAYPVAWNNWIIQGVKGELYPCKPDIFDDTYEPVDGPDDKSNR